MLASHGSARPIPSAALRFMRDRMLEARGASWLSRSNKARYRSICPSRLAWLGVNLKGGYDDLLSSFKKCYRTRLGNLGHPAAGEEALLQCISAALEVEI